MFPIRANQSLASTNTRTAVGRAPSSWNVLVAGVAASRIDEVFYRPLTAGNATSPVCQDVVVQRDTGSPTTTQHFWYAPQSVTPVHDFDGNLTNDGRWVYSWDAENRLVQMVQCDHRNISDKGEAGARRVSLAMTGEANQTTTQATAAGHPYTKLQFAYDWQGRRIARHVWQGGTQATPTFKSSHRWLYDGWNVITEFTATSATEQLPTRANTFTWGLDLSGTLQGAGGVGGLLALNDQLSTFNYSASYDGNGNIVAWTKSNASAPTSRREYDAFGNTLVSEGAAPSTFGFSTKMQDTETGLYYYGYRYYDPVTGRWPSRDPIGEDGGVNLYGFVGNDGLNQSDNLGAFVNALYVMNYVGDSNDFDAVTASAKEIGEGILYSSWLRRLLEGMSDEEFGEKTKNGIFARWYPDSRGELPAEIGKARDGLEKYNIDVSNVSRKQLIQWMLHEENSRIDALSTHDLVSPNRIFSVLESYSGDEEYFFDSLGFVAHGSIERGGIKVGPQLTGQRMPYQKMRNKLGEIHYFESRALISCGANDGESVLDAVISDPFFLDHENCQLTFTPIQIGFIFGGREPQ